MSRAVQSVFELSPSSVLTMVSRIDDSAGPDECWSWTGFRDQSGYGVFSPSRTARARVARMVLSIKLGRDLLSGMFALHRCDNPPCCNPDHLWEGDAADNNLDRASKARGAVGERHPRARLSKADVLAVRQAAVTEKLATLGRRYGVNETTIGDIVQGKTWKHLTGEQSP